MLHYDLIIAHDYIHIIIPRKHLNLLTVDRSIKRRLDAIVLRRTLLANSSVVFVVHDGHANVGRIDVAVAPDEKSAEARLSDEVEDTVEDGLGVGRDDVATLAETPGDGIQDPKEGCQRAAVNEALADLSSVTASVAAGFPGKLVEDVEKGDTA